MEKSKDEFEDGKIEIARQLNIIHMRLGDIERNLAKAEELLVKL
jgi:hypothetical protein